MPTWKKNYEPDSFMDIVQENQSMKAHSLILCDIGLDFKDALKQLEESAKRKNISMKKIVVCQALGTKLKKIRYGNVKDFEKEHFKNPFSIIIPSKLHFLEQEVLKDFEIQE